MFLVSRGLSLEKSGVRVWGSDSPVREELSTWGTKGEARIKDQMWSLARRARKITDSLLAHHRKEHEREHFGVKITSTKHVKKNVASVFAVCQHAVLPHQMLSNGGLLEVWVTACPVSHLAAVSRDDSQVSGDPVATLHLHQVSGHHFLGVDALLLALADDQGLLWPKEEDMFSGRVESMHHVFIPRWETWWLVFKKNPKRLSGWVMMMMMT